MTYGPYPQYSSSPARSPQHSRQPSATSTSTCQRRSHHHDVFSAGDTMEMSSMTDLMYRRQDPMADAIEYPGGLYLFLITTGLCLSVFCTSLDNTIIATAIPKITDQFGTLTDVGWYGSAYLLTTCAFQLVYGKLYTFYPLKHIFLLALLTFEAGSFICGIAPTSLVLIIGRAIAGLGSAGIFSGAVLIISEAVPLRSRPTYTGLMCATYGISSVAGPVLGGVFTDKVTWRWCFYINLPFGAVTGAFIMLFLKAPRVAKESPEGGWRGKLHELDVPGTCVFIPSVVAVLLALQWGGSKYAWDSGVVIGLFAGSAVAANAFIAIQCWRQERGTVPPRIFKQRSVWASAWFSGMLGAAFFVLTYYIPIWFQAIKGVSAVKSGMMNLPMIIGFVIFSLIAGVGVTLTGYYIPFMFLSSVLMAVGAGLLTTFDTSTAHPAWIGYQFIFGAGVGLGMQQTLIAVQATLPPADVPVGTALMMFSQTLGGALFISVGQNVFTNQLMKNLKHALPDGHRELKRIVLGTGATELREAVKTASPKMLEAVLGAYCKAITQTWYLSVATGVLSVVGVVCVKWVRVKGRGIGAGGGG